MDPDNCDVIIKVLSNVLGRLIDVNKVRLHQSTWQSYYLQHLYFNPLIFCQTVSRWPAVNHKVSILLSTWSFYSCLSRAYQKVRRVQRFLFRCSSDIYWSYDRNQECSPYLAKCPPPYHHKVQLLYFIFIYYFLRLFYLRRNSNVKTIRSIFLTVPFSISHLQFDACRKVLWWLFL